VEDKLVKIFIDAGHGGADSGAVGNGLQEKNITLDICQRIAAGLKAYENVTVLMSRTGDTFPSLNDRTNAANAAKADLFVSVHINSGAATARGFESHIYTNTDAGTKAFQNVMHTEIYNAAYKAAGEPDRGKKQSNFHVLRESNMKAILTENLFISNAADAKNLADADFRQKIAQGHINGLEKFLGLKKGAQPPPTEKPTGGKLWKVQVGAFEDEKAARDLATDLQRQGYRPYVYQE
jgi:N-acetylmuramoyl-L-alanine amidase